ncbi:hypothetical protein HPP92_006413 [Vanilla planifolia]|uniref:Uncharacterized protein n=1 Tax=Vanilla planifolia TaxID=51239 RepID=A0A835VA94_VANPL|nr:hypothetical protein HPP92_006413 [Vanilla planifolia]
MDVSEECSLTGFHNEKGKSLSQASLPWIQRSKLFRCGSSDLWVRPPQYRVGKENKRKRKWEEK